MRLHAFIDISEAGTGVGYNGWLSYSGYWLEFSEPMRHNKPLHIKERFDWDSIYKKEFAPNIIPINVSSNITIRELKQKLIELLRRKKKLGCEDFKIQFDFASLCSSIVIADEMGNGERFKIQFELYHPLKGVSPLDEALTLQEIGLLDDDILFLSGTYKNPNIMYSLIPSCNAEAIFSSIQASAETIGNLNNNEILGVLLYTDEDLELAKFVRRYFTSLDKLTGDWCSIYVMEQTPVDWRSTNKYWHSTLEAKVYQIWCIVRWLVTKPYNKSEAYDIGRKLGVFPDQLPCLVLIGDINSHTRLVFPISTVSTEFFRRIFSLMERMLSTVSKQNTIPDSKMEPSRRKLFSILTQNFDEIVKQIDEMSQKSSSINQVQYVFEGNTVFINEPRGDITLSDFQNDTNKI